MTLPNAFWRRALLLVVGSLGLVVSRAAAPLELALADTLHGLCDALLTTQITDRHSPDFGALVCPSVNPQPHPLHSRAGEAVYPLAVMYRRTGDVKYRDAAIRLGNWMIGKQQSRGAWGEEWPNYDGWTGTTSDQLISLAGAYDLLRTELAPADAAKWRRSISRAAEYVERTFPMGNINYQPTGAVALRFAAAVIPDAPAKWTAKAGELMRQTMAAVNRDGFLVGEGNGVDLGYNLAQSIGYIALYARLTNDAALRHRAAEMLRTHFVFVYPNGTVDNSWGTRSYKWTYESGTKTAPGVYFTFALLADEDPRFATANRLCLEYLRRHAIHDGLIGYGPDGGAHHSTEPPCLYSTFARAQSLALALQYAPTEAATTESARIPAQETDWWRFFPTVNVAVVRTKHLMATISAYGEFSRYGRGLVPRGGSLTNLWVEGFGENGFAQASSVTDYRREEAMHMPIEGELEPLTPRVEATLDGRRYTNLYDAAAKLTVSSRPDGVEVRAEGTLTDSKGDSSGVAYTIIHRFSADRLTKIYTVHAPRPVEVRVVEPFVKQPHLRVTAAGQRTIQFSAKGRPGWELAASSPAAVSVGFASDPERFWCPFPAVECVPVVVRFSAPAKDSELTLDFGPAR